VGMRFPLSAVAIAGLALAFPSSPGATSALAQSRGNEPAAKQAPAAPQRDRSQDIEFLFGALKAAPDAASAKAVENRIMALWVASGSDTADLLMSRVKTAMDGQDLDLAIKLLDAIIDLQPNYAEAWNRRATVYFLKKEYGQSLTDIRQVLAREPRHFGAIAGLGMIMQELGEEKRALEAFRRALDLHPHLQKIPDLIKGLTEKVDGRDI
jgi:tetratricopeptide (TPR) repeat protein